MASIHLTQFGKLILFLSAVYHWPMGILSMLSVAWTKKLTGFLYDLKIPDQLDPRYEYTWKPLGASGVFIALTSTLAYLNSQEDLASYLLSALALLYMMRALLRWFYRELFQRAYGVSLKRNLINIVFNITLVASIAIFGFARN